MKLSFVIPAFNEEKKISACLASIIEQLSDAPCDVEVIVVDNASTDRTAEVAKTFQGIHIVHEPERGLVKARRAGYLASTGDLIANVDADTMLTPHWIKKVADNFSREKDLVALSGPFIYYDLSLSRRFLVDLFYRLGYLTYLLNRFVLNTGSMLQGGNFIIRRDGIEKIGGYDTSIAFYGEDADLARRLHKIGPVRFTFSLPMYASGRRLAAEGIFTMGWRYGINYLSTIFMKRPVTKEWKDIRPE